MTEFPKQKQIGILVSSTEIIGAFFFAIKRWQEPFPFSSGSDKPCKAERKVFYMVLSNQLSNALWSYRDYLFASGEVFSVPISWQNAFIRHGMTPSNAKKCHQIGPSSIFLKTINYKYVGAIHHGVPYELCHEVLSQKNIFFVMPKFKSYCAYHMTAEDLKLPPDMQILAAKKWLRALPDSNLQKFGLCQRDIDRIKNNNFSSFTWHHSGRKELSLVDSCVHSKCRHTGYASIFFPATAVNKRYMTKHIISQRYLANF